MSERSARNAASCATRVVIDRHHPLRERGDALLETVLVVRDQVRGLPPDLGQRRFHQPQPQVQVARERPSLGRPHVVQALQRLRQRRVDQRPHRLQVGLRLDRLQQAAGPNQELERYRARHPQLGLQPLERGGHGPRTGQVRLHASGGLRDVLDLHPGLDAPAGEHGGHRRPRPLLQIGIPRRQSQGQVQRPAVVGSQLDRHGQAPAGFGGGGIPGHAPDHNGSPGPDGSCAGRSFKSRPYFRRTAERKRRSGWSA